MRTGTRFAYVRLGEELGRLWREGWVAGWSDRRRCREVVIAPSVFSVAVWHNGAGAAFNRRRERGERRAASGPAVSMTQQ